MSALLRLLIGAPLPTRSSQLQRLPKILALPVFASDAMSSVAYATDEILLVLTRYAAPAMGAAALGYSVPVALAIAALLVIITASYQQTIHAYPSGGGAYVVARDNLGEAAAQVAGAALLTDYILTVSVSVAAGVAAIDSALPQLLPYRVHLCLLCITFITIVNVRGVKESGMVFAGPAYLFVATVIFLLITGFIHVLRHGAPAMPSHVLMIGTRVGPLTQAAFVFVLLHAFSNGCTALTGVEAISNGVTAFRPPEARNASITLLWMSGILMTMFIGITTLTRAFHVFHLEHETALSQLGRAVFGESALYYVLQASTTMILIVAANTSFADFPRVASLIAGDGFLPRQFTQLGDRLVFQNGIVALGVISSVLVFIFRGTVDALIPLYAIGVFLSFTMSQTGMVKRWWRLRTPGWKRNALINGVGALSCATVVIVFAATKFRDGAWIVIVMVPLLVAGFFRIHRHYESVDDELLLAGATPAKKPLRHKVLVLVPRVHKGVLPAITYARSIANRLQDVRAIFVELQPGSAAATREQWKTWGEDIPLIVLESPLRHLIDPIIDYVHRVLDEEKLDLVTVVVPEFATSRWWHALLHNQSGLQLKLALLHESKVVVSNVRYQLR